MHQRGFWLGAASGIGIPHYSELAANRSFHVLLSNGWSGAPADAAIIHPRLRLCDDAPYAARWHAAVAVMGIRRPSRRDAERSCCCAGGSSSWLPGIGGDRVLEVAVVVGFRTPVIPQ